MSNPSQFPKPPRQPDRTVSGAYEDLLEKHQDIPVYQGKIPEFVPVEVLSMRPDIRGSEEKLKAAVARIGVAEADYYPTFELIGGIGIGAAG